MRFVKYVAPKTAVLNRFKTCLAKRGGQVRIRPKAKTRHRSGLSGLVQRKHNGTGIGPAQQRETKRLGRRRHQLHTGTLRVVPGDKNVAFIRFPLGAQDSIISRIPRGSADTRRFSRAGLLPGQVDPVTRHPCAGAVGRIHHTNAGARVTSRQQRG